MASKSTARRKFKPKPLPEVDLKPIMNLMVVLIPMLLYSASFIKFAAVNATKASGSGPPKQTKPDDKIPRPPLKLKVKITEEGFVIEAAAIIDEGTMLASAGDGDGQPVELYTIDVDETLSEKAMERLSAEYKEKGKAVPDVVLEATKKVYSYDYLKLNSEIGKIKKAVRNGEQAALSSGEIEEGEVLFEKADQIIIAAQGNIPYELLIKVMDTVRCKMLTDEQKEARKEKIKEIKEKEGKATIKSRNKFGCTISLDAQGDENANTYYYDVIMDSRLID